MTMITTEGGWKQMLLLTIVVVIYLCAGAAIFSAIELEPELERRNVLRGYLERFIGKIRFKKYCLISEIS